MNDRTKTHRFVISFSLVILVLTSGSFLQTDILATAIQPEGVLHYTISFEEPRLQEITLQDRTFTQIEMTDCISQNSPGNPALPLRSIRILLPYGKTVAEISVTYQTCVELTTKMENPIIPQQDLVTTETEETNDTPLFNETVYNSVTPLFDYLYTDTNIGYCRGYPILTLNLRPIQYIPKTGGLYYFPTMDITLNLHNAEQPTGDATSPRLRGTHDDSQIVESMVINPEVIESFDPKQQYQLFVVSDGLCNPDDTYEYLIITNEALNNTAGETYNWSDLLTHRTTYNGLTVTKKTVETIDACPAYWSDDPLFNDSAAHVREFIKDAYNNWGTQYVVLGGDWDTSNPTNQIIPARIFTDWNSKLNGDPYYSMPCDMYYSHLDGDWRDTVNNCWGGGSNSGVNDPFAEVMVGRMTISTAEQLSNFIKKIIWYDLSADNEFVNKAAFFGGNLGGQYPITSADYLEELRSGDDPNFYECIGFTEWNQNNSDSTFDTSSQVYYNWGASIPTDYQQVINNNQAGLINHLGHGLPTIALDMTTGQLNALTNTKFFFAFSQQCLAGRFTDGDTTEKTLTSLSDDNGAFGLIWNTGYGWFSGTDTNGPNQFLQRMFWDYLFSTTQDNWQIGAAFTYAEDMLSPYVDLPDWHYAWCYNWYSANFFGDPAQTLKVSVPEPTSCGLSQETPTNETINVPAGTISLSITVADEEADRMDIIFLTNASGSWEEIGSNTSQLNGTYSQTYSFTSEGTTYWWSVHVHDTEGVSGWTNETYWFTIEPNHIPSTPAEFQAITYNKTQINLTWIKGENATHTSIERSFSSDWNRGEGLNVYNDTGISYIDQHLTMENTYYYRAWSWNNEDALWSTHNILMSNTTRNIAPLLSNETPTNQSENHEYNPPLSITVTDLDEDSMDITFWTNATGPWTIIGTNESVPHGWYQQLPNEFTSSSTTYWWSVNCTDGKNWTNETYHFTTQYNQPSFQSTESPINQSITVEQNIASLTITISDSEDDIINWSIETSPHIGNISVIADHDGVKTCTLTGVQYYTTYYWYVNVTDNGSETWNNQSYWFTTEEQQQNIYLGGGGSDEEQESNNPPRVPMQPNGTNQGYLETRYPFTTVSTDPDNDSICYQFDWGDTTLSNWTTAVPSGTSINRFHQWHATGIYLVKARVKDEHGAESEWSGHLQVQIDQKMEETQIEVKINLNQSENLSVYHPIYLNAEGIIGFEDKSLEYSWDFGDGTQAVGKETMHTYNSPGEYAINLLVFNNEEVIASTTITVQIKAQSTVEQQNTDTESTSSFIIYFILFGCVGGFVGLILFLWKKHTITSTRHGKGNHSQETLKRESKDLTSYRLK